MNLSNKQYSVIVSTWKKDDFEWLFKIGTEIYSEIFRMEPDAKLLFPYIVDCEKNQKDFKELKQFKIQALRFVQVLSKAVNLLTENDPSTAEFEKYLFQLGQKHREFAQFGFKPEYWDYFNYAVVNIMEKECRSSRQILTEEQQQFAKEGWKILSNFIITCMKNGFGESLN